MADQRREMDRWAKALVARINKAMAEQARAMQQLALVIRELKMCSTCGAIVSEHSEAAHQQWHERQDGGE